MTGSRRYALRTAWMLPRWKRPAGSKRGASTSGTSLLRVPTNCKRSARRYGSAWNSFWKGNQHENRSDGQIIDRGTKSRKLPRGMRQKLRRKDADANQSNSCVLSGMLFRFLPRGSALPDYRLRIVPVQAGA